MKEKQSLELETPPSRQVRRQAARRAAKAMRSQLKKKAMEERTKGGSAVIQ